MERCWSIPLPLTSVALLAVAETMPCGRPATDMAHIVPKVPGGSDEPSNLQSLCAQDNRQKSARVDRRAGC